MTPSEQDSREKIIRAAIEEFAQHGKAGARMDRIALSAGLNKAMLYYYFTSKDLLYSAVIRKMLEMIMERQILFATLDIPVRERIDQVVGFMIDFLHENPTILRLMVHEILEGGETAAAVAAELAPDEAIPFKTGIAGVMAEGMRAGVIRGNDVVQVALNVFSLCAFHSFFMPLIRVMWRLEDRNDDDFLEKRKQSIRDLLQHGILNLEPKS